MVISRAKSTSQKGIRVVGTDVSRPCWRSIAEQDVIMQVEKLLWESHVIWLTCIIGPYRERTFAQLKAYSDSRNLLAIGRRRSRPNARGVIFTPTGA